MLFHEKAFIRIKSERSQKGRNFPILRVKMAPAAGAGTDREGDVESFFERRSQVNGAVTRA